MNSETENAFVVAMAEEALAIDNNIGRDFWLGGVKTADGTWRWRSGDPMDYTNWCKHCPDTGREGWVYSQLLKKGYPSDPGTLDTFYWARETSNGNAGHQGPGENGVICEINVEK